MCIYQETFFIGVKLLLIRLQSLFNHKEELLQSLLNRK